MISGTRTISFTITVHSVDEADLEETFKSLETRMYLALPRRNVMARKRRIGRIIQVVRNRELSQPLPEEA